jgi:DNA-binding MarR family transcriptional regulator
MSRPSNLRSIVSAPNARGLDDHIAVRIARITEIVSRIATLTIEARWGLSNTDLRLLNNLDGSPPMAVSELSRRAHVDKAWVSRSLRDLENRKLVQRRSHSKDSRLALISLTSQGQRLLDEVRPFALKNEIELLSGIDARLLKKLLGTLEENADAQLRRFQALLSPAVKQVRKTGGE